MSKPPRSLLDDAIADIVSARIRAIDLRFAKRDPNAEKPSEVAQAFVVGLSPLLEARLGPLTFVKSRRSIEAVRGDLTYAYPFQSSSENVAGATIRLFPHVEVSSKRLKDWRRVNAKPGVSRRLNDGYFAGGMLGNLLNPKQYVSLELIEPASRPATAALVCDMICAVDAALQTALRDPASLVASPFADLPMDIAEYLAAHGRMDDAIDYLRTRVDAVKDGWLQYDADMERLGWNGGDVLSLKARGYVRDAVLFSYAYTVKLKA